MDYTAPRMEMKKPTTALRKILLLSLCASLAGCAAPPLRPGASEPARVTDSINLSGFPPEYKRGFTAGCEYARHASAGSAQPPKGDAALVQGWKDGRDYCTQRTRR